MTDPVIATMQSWLDGEPVWPYAKILKEWGPDFEMYRRRWSRELGHMLSTGKITSKEFDLERMFRLANLRNEWIRLFGFAIPCAELLDELEKSTHVVEVGAGTGYMTRLMRNHGISVTGSDYDFRGPNSHGFETAKYDDEQVTGVEAKTMVRRYPKSTVFCSWPTLRETWFRQMLKAMQVGQQLVVIREDACAEDSAWEYLDDCFDAMSHVDIPTFEHMNDFASVHIKKRNRPKA